MEVTTAPVPATAPTIPPVLIAPFRIITEDDTNTDMTTGYTRPVTTDRIVDSRKGDISDAVVVPAVDVLVLEFLDDYLSIRFNLGRLLVVSLTVTTPPVVEGPSVILRTTPVAPTVEEPPDVNYSAPDLCAMDRTVAPSTPEPDPLVTKPAITSIATECFIAVPE